MELNFTLPEGYQGVMPYLIIQESEAFLEFLMKVFDAKEKMKVMNKEGTNIMHAEAIILGRCIMFGSSEKSPEEPSGLSISVENVDETYKKALEAGATSIMEPMSPPWTKRFAGFKDRFGNTWWIAERKEDVQVPERDQGLCPYLVLKNAPAFLDFLKKVFCAEEVSRNFMEDGKTIINAESKVSGSAIKCCEGSEKWGYQNGGIFVYVANADETHKVALAEGATEVVPPSNQTYGRSSGVKDPFGNTFWITSALKECGV